MLAQKVIFRGRLDFGSQEAVRKLVPQLVARITTLYKDDYPWKPELVLPEDSQEITFKPISTQMADRTWKHGMDSLKWMSQFAICGRIVAYRLGAERDKHVIRPTGQKAAVLFYQQSLQTEDLTERQSLLKQAIDKYPHHVEALVASAKIAMHEGAYDIAYPLLEKAAVLDPDNPLVWLYRARKAQQQNDLDAARMYVEKSISLAMPLEDIHWQGRWVKSKIALAVRDVATAEAEWDKLHTKLSDDKSLCPGLLDKVKAIRAETSVLSDAELAVVGSSSVYK